MEADAKLQQIWLLYAVVFVLHGIADPVITYLSINVLGIGAELNPLFRGAIEEGAMQFALSYLPLLLIAVVCFVALTLLFRRADGEEREQIYRISVVVLALCIVWGVLLVGWNLWVLTSGL